MCISYIRTHVFAMLVHVECTSKHVLRIMPYARLIETDKQCLIETDKQ